MEHCRAAEHALVASLVLGQAEPGELSGRLRVSDFTDPAAGLIFETVMAAAAHGGQLSGEDLPRLLRSRGALRGDGYPVRELLEWLPRLSVPAHPEAWATLVVAGSLGRLVEQSGVRLLQGCEVATADVWGAGRVLALAAAQRAAVHSGARRWRELPERWRGTLPSGPTSPDPIAGAHEDRVRAPSGDEQRLERELLSGLVAAPGALDQMPWLRQEDFGDRACADVYAGLRALHDTGQPVDLVTLTAALPPASADRRAAVTVSAQVCQELRPDLAFPASLPWLGRQLLEASVLRQAQRTGTALVELAAAPASSGGSGGRMLDRAGGHLDDLAQHGGRLTLSQQSAPVRTDTRAADRVGLSLLRTDPSQSVLPAAAQRQRSVPDRTAG